MVGMIPMPEEQYRAAIDGCLDALRRAMTPAGLDTAALRPPPARMMPVAQDPHGNLYALVETCNSNHRPTAVPLATFYPERARPDEFVPLSSLEDVPPPPVDEGLAEAGNRSSEMLSRILAALPQEAGSGFSANGVQGILPGGSTLPGAGISHAADTVASSAPAAGMAAAGTDALTRQQTTEHLLRLADETAKAGGRPDGTGGLSPMILGITATQDPRRSSAVFERMLAEKEAGLSPNGGIYQRLQVTLASIPQTPPAIS